MQFLPVSRLSWCRSWSVSVLRKPFTKFGVFVERHLEGLSYDKCRSGADEFRVLPELEIDFFLNADLDCGIANKFRWRFQDWHCGICSLCGPAMQAVIRNSFCSSYVEDSARSTGCSSSPFWRSELVVDTKKGGSDPKNFLGGLKPEKWGRSRPFWIFFRRYFLRAKYLLRLSFSHMCRIRVKDAEQSRMQKVFLTFFTCRNGLHFAG